MEDNKVPKMCGFEYPFYREGMTWDEFEKEKKYYCEHRGESDYKSLYEQNKL